MRIKLIAAAALAAALAVPATAEAGDWSVRVRVGGHSHHRHHHHHHHRAHVRRVVHAPVVQRGHWEIRRVKVWVPGYHKKVVRPAVWEQRYDPATCTTYEVLVKPKRVRLVWVPGYHEIRRQRVWVPAASCAV